MKESDLYHKWIEWSDDDQVYIGKCPDWIAGIYGDVPVKSYGELCGAIEDVVNHFIEQGRKLPSPHARHIQKWHV